MIDCTRAMDANDAPAITERQQSEALRARLAAIVDFSDDAIVSKTLDGVITSWNRGAERLFGYTAAEAVGRHIFLIIPADRREEEIEVLAHLGRGERIEHFDTIRQAKDGHHVAVSLTVSPIKDSRGSIIGASKVARDITERKRAEETLRRAHEELEERVPEVETMLYRLAQEALNNIVKHARAECADVVLERSAEYLSLIVEDNGIGFDLSSVGSIGGGVGLLGMRERAALVGADLQIESTPGRGTTVIVRVPAHAAAARIP